MSDAVAPGDEAPPDELGRLLVDLHVAGADAPQSGAVSRVSRAIVVGLMFSVFPVILTNLVLTRAETGFDPRALGAAIPVVAVSIWLSRPRDRWYAVGELGFAMGERFFGQIRWDKLLFDEIEMIEVETRRAENGAGAYRFTGYRFIFDGGAKKRVVLEGEVDETEPRGTLVRLPPDDELPPRHELRAARAALLAWSRATGRSPALTDTLL